MSVMVRFLALSVCDNYSKSSIKPPPPGAYLFETHLRVRLIRDGGLFKRWGGGVLLIEFSKEGGISSP